MTDRHFDVLVIGGGPGGYVAAIRAAQLGLATACVEMASYGDAKGEVRLGGTCLNVGCIPSKALLYSSELYATARERFARHGIRCGELSIDLATLMARKDAIVSQLTQGIRGLFRKNRVTLLPGRATFVGRAEAGWRLRVSGPTEAATFTARHVVIATGSVARSLPGSEIDNVTICDNVGALSWQTLPARLGIIGAGVIGLELGSVWRRLGSEVTLLEAAPQFLAAADAAIAKEALRHYSRQGLKIELGARCTAVERASDGGVTVRYEVAGAARHLDCDKLIVAIGRVPYTAGLGAEAVGLALTEQGAIAVDTHCRTNLEGVWAIGDVVRGPMLAHKAMEEGVMVAERIAGQLSEVNYEAIPWVIYTQPEIAWVGKSEAQLKAEGRAYRVGQATFAANGRALGHGEASGFVKILACAESDRLLGVHIIGPHASELIAEAVVALEFGASAEDLARTCHAHPTLAEVMHEAALAVDGRALHH